MSLFDDYTLPIDRNRPAGVLPPPRNQKDARCYHDIAAWLDAQASLMSNGGQPTTNLLITFRRLVWASALQATARDIAAISRDPEKTNTATQVGGGQSLADLGYMREYIEGLPYTSEVMNLDLARWQEWSAQQQFEFINQLDKKIAYYAALHENVDLWISLDGGAVDGDSLHPLLLEALP